MTTDEAGDGLEELMALPTELAEEYEDWKPNYMIRVSPVSEKQDKPGKPPSANGGSSRAPASKEELDYLESVATSLFLSATQRDRSLGISSWKGNKIRGQLLKKCLLNAVAINPGGRGRKFQLLELTENGEQLLTSYGTRVPKGRGRGGVEHQWWTWRISEWLEKRGITSTIEDESLGARVDIAVEFEQGMIAIEVEITSWARAIENIRKDLDAGSAHVVSLLKEAGDVDKLRVRIIEEIPERASHVYVGPLAKYQEFLTGLVCFGKA